MAANKSEYRAPALEKALDIIELLSNSNEPLSKKEISARLDKTVNEIFRMLEVLKVRGYVLHNEEQGEYELSLKMFELSNHFPPTKRLLHTANPEMEALSDQLQQSCHLAVFDRGHMLCVAKQESPYKMGFSLRLGANIDLFGSGSGIAMLAFSEEESRTRMLAQSNATEAEVKFMLNQLQETQERGYFIGASPQVSGVTNISFPVLNIFGQAEVILTVPFLTLDAENLHHKVIDIEKACVYAQQSAMRLTKSIGGKWHLPEVSAD
jgi:DNA-binding IclR family transcriptional regulator